MRQLRLRNLGGIIVIDFIDMMDAAHRENVMRRLQEELERDRNHARAVEISDFGLVEMTRKRTGPSLERLLTSGCPHCGGSGRRLSAETVVLGVYREMARQGERLRGAPGAPDPAQRPQGGAPARDPGGRERPGPGPGGPGAVAGALRWPGPGDRHRRAAGLKSPWWPGRTEYYNAPRRCHDRSRPDSPRPPQG